MQVSQDKLPIRLVPLEPEDYCKRWVPTRYGKMPGEWGYRAACVRELAKVSGVQSRSIDVNWGACFEKRPHYIPRLLRLADILNQLEARKVVSVGYGMDTNRGRF